MRVGTVVRVPLHGRRVRGWVVADDVEPDPDAGRLLPIAKVVGAGPPAELLELGRWAAHRWAGSEVAPLPRRHRAERGARSVARRRGAGAGPGFSVEAVAWPPAADRRELVADAPRAGRVRPWCSCPRAPGSARWSATSCGAGTGCSSLRSELEATERTRAWAAARRGDGRGGRRPDRGVGAAARPRRGRGARRGRRGAPGGAGAHVARTRRRARAGAAGGGAA